MLNVLDRFVNADTEPTKQERGELAKSLADYICIDCVPDSRVGDETCFRYAMCAVKAIVPEKDFGSFIERVNVGRSPKVKAADFDREPAAPKKAQEAPAQELVRETEPQ